jgi:hypothetical protein
MGCFHSAQFFAVICPVLMRQDLKVICRAPPWKRRNRSVGVRKREVGRLREGDEKECENKLCRK